MTQDLKKATMKMSTRIKKKAFILANKQKSNVIHLFLLSPPLSGSTAIKQLIDTSPYVTCFPGNGEGQKLPGASSLLYVNRRWDPDLKIDWNKVKNIYYSYWLPTKPVRFEKSPPNIVRAKQIEHVFKNSHFLITIRNPYAVVEGLLRRNWPFNEFGPQSISSSPLTPKVAAEFWIRNAYSQLKNMKQLEKKYFFRYEDLTESTDRIIKEIIEFVPQIECLTPESEFTSHNITGASIVGLKNLNEIKINSLSETQIKEINDVLHENLEILNKFGYKLLGN